MSDQETKDKAPLTATINRSLAVIEDDGNMIQIDAEPDPELADDNEVHIRVERDYVPAFDFYADTETVLAWLEAAVRMVDARHRAARY